MTIYKLDKKAQAGLGDVNHFTAQVTGVDAKNKLDGAKFKLTRVTKAGKEAGTKKEINLKTFDGWKNASEVVAALNADTTNTTLVDLSAEPADTKTVITGAANPDDTDKGQAIFSDMPVGLYRVEEVKAPAGYVQANPFYITIPMAVANQQFNYEYNIVPKNSKPSDLINKAQDTTGTVAPGDKISYTVTVDDSALSDTAANMKGLRVWDDLLTAAYTQAAAETATAETALKAKLTVKAGDTPLAGTNDYTVQLQDGKVGGVPTTDGDPKLGAGRVRLMVTFTEDGLRKIAAAQETPKKDVTLKLDLTLADNASGEIINLFGYQPGAPEGSTPGQPVAPGTTPGTGEPNPGDPDYNNLPKLNIITDLTIQKVKASDGTTQIDGAEFYVFTKKDEADACALVAANERKNSATCQNATSLSKNIGRSGVLTIGKQTPALVMNNDTNKVYLVEVTAPGGYILSPEVTTITINATNGTDSDIDVKIANVSTTDGDGKNWFELPETGGRGIAIMGISGGLLLLGGVIVFLAYRRRRAAQEA
ncbi:SpaH/EbpB family LPXTG-anchored major pilin [Arcanobacterium hippocoleae]|uniref:SpaH/EbpB family LPXTG-anchored major pilin n=1 Tax=Arcanobacterium hippocoleae TaxID=149017 RepID=UPI003341E64F